MAFLKRSCLGQTLLINLILISILNRSSIFILSHVLEMEKITDSTTPKWSIPNFNLLFLVCLPHLFSL